MALRIFAMQRFAISPRRPSQDSRKACTDRATQPRVGEKVYSKGGTRIIGNGSIWKLLDGQVATVEKVDEDGDFKLKNPSGEISEWTYARYYTFEAPGAAMLRQLEDQVASAWQARSAEPEEKVIRGRRKPFSRWRCIFRPLKANDPDECEPISTVKIRVDRAFNLIKDTVSGVCRPYVSIAVSGGQRKTTKTFEGNLVTNATAFEWKETFEFDVYHPLSSLIVKFYNDRHLVQDKLVGWLEIQLGAWPINQDVAGWFEISHPDVLKRLMQEEFGEDQDDLADKKAGSVHLMMHLATSHPEDEAYAMCLPLPDQINHSHVETLNLQHFFEEVIVLLQKVNEIRQVLQDGVEVLWKRTTVFRLWLLGVTCVWRPAIILPGFIFVLGSLVVYHDYMTCCKTSREEEIGGPPASTLVVQRQEPQRKPRGRLAVLSDAVHVVEEKVTWARKRVRSAAEETVKVSRTVTRREDSRSGLMEPLMRDAGAADLLQAGANTKIKEDKQSDDSSSDSEHVADEDVQFAAKVFTGLEKWLPKDSQRTLHEAAPAVHEAMFHARVWESLLRNRFARLLIKLCFLVITVFLFYYREWQPLVVQVCLTCWMTGEAVKRSFIARIWMASLAYNSWKRRHPECAHSEQSSHYFRWMQARKRHRRTSFMVEGFKDDLFQEMQAVPEKRTGRTHVMALQSFRSPAFCLECGNLLLGLADQGMLCQHCGHVCCKVCARLLLDTCPGAPANEIGIPAKRPKAEAFKVPDNAGLPKMCGVNQLLCCDAPSKMKRDAEEYVEDPVERLESSASRLQRALEDAPV